MNGDDAHGTVSARCPVHVGRSRPMAAILAAAQATADSARVLFVGGEAGIGKSRLAGEAVAAARARRQTVLAAGCHAGASIPYEPYVALMRRALRRLDRAETRDLFRGTARFAAALLPEMAEAGEPARIPELDPHHTDAAVVEILVRLVDDGWGLLCLEDLHWAGGDTVRVLTHLLRECDALPLWLVATYRDGEVAEGHPLWPLLVEAQGSDRCSMIHLGALRGDDVAAMVAAMLGEREATDRVVETIASRSEGNPLFVEELCARLADSGAVEDAGERGALDLSAATLPASMRESVLARLHGVDPAVRDLLCVAAVAGETIEPALIERATGAGTAAVDAALVIGIERRLVVERHRSGLPAYAFRHALTREAVAADITGPARRIAHRRIASALAATAAPERAGEAADHRAAAGDAEEAHGLALTAARFAARCGAATACRLRYEQALRLAADDPHRLETLVEAAETLRAADPDAAEALVAEGSALARRAGDALALARLLIVKAVMVWWRGQSTTASQAFAEAHGLVRGRGDDWELHILLELARAHANRDEMEPAGRLLERGAELVAAGIGSRRDTVDLLTVSALLGRGDVERTKRYDAALDAAARLGDAGMECVAIADAGFAALWWPGDLGRARSLLWRAAGIADAVRPVNAIAYRAAAAWTEAVAGELDAASASAHGILAQTSSPPSRLMAFLALHEVHERRGSWDQASACAAEALALAEATGEPQWIVPATGAVARARLQTGLEGALPWFEQALRAAGRSQPHWYASPDLARALLAAGAVDQLCAWAREVAQESTPGEHRHDTAALSLCAGLSALAAGEPDEARDLLTEARDAYKTMHCLAREAEAHVALAALERRAGDRVSAIQAATAALGIAQRLGSGHMVDEARAMLRLAGIRTQPARRPGGPDGPSPLSPREREVGALVAAGLSNQEIAHRLFISENTVERHVSHILAKLGLRRRAQVAGWAGDLGA